MQTELAAIDVYFGVFILNKNASLRCYNTFFFLNNMDYKNMIIIVQSI